MTHHGAANKPHIRKELEVDIVVSEAESDKKFVRNTFGAKRRAPIGGGWNKRQSS
jgi:hypothetical protein